MHMTGFECLVCLEKQPAGYAGYVCPSCGGNLDVTYDYAAIRSALDPDQPFGSDRRDIFRYAPLYPVDNVQLAPKVSVGGTPLYHAERLGGSIGLKNVYLKDDGLNPSASFKDRASAVAITKAREMGVAVVAGASTGNAGSSMACMAASVDMPCVVFIPEKAPTAKIAQLLIFGAHVMAVRGTYDDAFDLCFEVCRERGWFNRNTGYNPFTREGKKSCSFEICEQLGWNAPDWIVVPTGDGNIISGIWKGLRDLHAIGLIDRLPRLACAQSELSSAIAQTIWAVQEQHSDESSIDWSSVEVKQIQATTVADSISVDLPRDGIAATQAVLETNGTAVTVPDEDILAAIREVARGAGVFCEPSCATSWAVLKKMAAEGTVKPDERVVCLMTGSGLKDITNALKVAGQPSPLDADLAAANKALDALGL